MIGVLAVAWTCVVADASAQTRTRRQKCGSTADVDLDQNWDNAKKAKFWFNSQGSRIMLYSWFIALEQKDNENLLIDSCFMESLGFIVLPNHTLPIGIAKDENRTGTATYAGLTCAACHTSRLTIGGKTAIVEGGPALVDFSRFLNALVDSTTNTYQDDGKFERWADKVNDTSIPRDTLRERLKDLAGELTKRRDQNEPWYEYGFGRVDAFGHIFNRVFATATGADDNKATPNAPVSYPFLWDTPRNIHENVQWNWSAPNKVAFGLVPGDLIRNIGEMLGVFGTFDLTKPSRCLVLVPCYKTSSFNRGKLERLENLVKTLWSPRWPSQLKGMEIKNELLGEGAKIYAEKCERCHVITKRSDPRRKAGDRLVPLTEVNTDSEMTDAFNHRIFEQALKSGHLEGRPIGLTSPGREFRQTTNGDTILSHVLIGVWLGAGSNDGRAITQEAAKAPLQKGYKARSLNGIWATSPYLHNGSVPNLRTLLSRSRGDGFWVGNNAFDPKNVGLSIEEGANATWFNPYLEGNGNQGHWFGVDDLDDTQKEALIEFLKQL